MKANWSSDLEIRAQEFGAKSGRETERTVWRDVSNILHPYWFGAVCLLVGLETSAFSSQGKQSIQKLTSTSWKLTSCHPLTTCSLRKVFQQDLAPAHNWKKTKEFLHLHNIEVLGWPANSPDLSIFEFVWLLMKRRIQEAHPKTLDELRTVISAVWHLSFTPEKLLPMVECAKKSPGGHQRQRWCYSLLKYWLLILYLFCFVIAIKTF